MRKKKDDVMHIDWLIQIVIRKERSSEHSFLGLCGEARDYYDGRQTELKCQKAGCRHDGMPTEFKGSGIPGRPLRLKQRMDSAPELPPDGPMSQRFS